MSNFGNYFGALIAYILLCLYGCTVSYMIVSVCAAAPGAPVEFNSGVKYVVTTVGGLVSALVVAQLALTTPGSAPTLARADAKDNERLFRRLAIAYMLVWLCVGLAALVVGTMFFPTANSTLSELGTTWLGLAVAAGYAYFGLNPNG